MQLWDKPEKDWMLIADSKLAHAALAWAETPHDRLKAHMHHWKAEQYCVHNTKCRHKETWDASHDLLHVMQSLDRKTEGKQP